MGVTARRVGWSIMTIFAIIIAAYAAAVLLVPTFGPPFINERRLAMPWAVIAHLAGGTLAMALGPWQFSKRIRQRAISVHRWTGRGYIVSVLVGGLGALVLVPGSQFGWVTHLGFGLGGVAWLITTVQGYRNIKAKDTKAHRRWMTRSFALTFAAVTLRIELPLGLALGIAIPVMYQVVSWLCWVPNLLFAEWLIRRPSPPRQAVAPGAVAA